MFEINEDKELSHAQVRVLITVVRHTDNKSGEIRCSQEVMAEKIGMSKQNFGRYLKSVPQWIEVINTTRRTASLKWVRSSQGVPQVINTAHEVITESTSGNSGEYLSTISTVESTQTLQYKEKNKRQNDSGESPDLKKSSIPSQSPTANSTGNTPTSADIRKAKTLVESALGDTSLTFQFGSNQRGDTGKAVQISKNRGICSLKGNSPQLIKRLPNGSWVLDSSSPDWFFKQHALKVIDYLFEKI